MSKLLLKVVAFSAICFMISYAFALMSKSNVNQNFPGSLVAAYFNRASSLYWGFDFDGGMQQVNVQKELDVNQIFELSVRTDDIDIEAEPSSASQLVVELNGEVTVSEKSEEIFKINTEKETLNIEVLARNPNFQWGFEEQEGPRARLKIKVPDSLTRLTIKTIAGDILVDRINATQMQIDTISGNVSYEGEKLEKLIYKSVSGDLDVKAPLQDGDLESVSGDFAMNLDFSSPQLRIKTASGDASMKFSKTPDLWVNFKSVSGELHTDSSSQSSETPGSVESRVKLGSGKSSLDFESISGNLTL